MRATNHDVISAIPTTAKIEKVYSPAELCAKPIGTKPAMVTRVAHQHGGDEVLAGEHLRLRHRIAGGEPTRHRIDRGHRIVDQERERNDRRAEGDPLQVDVGEIHERKDDGEGEGNGDRDHEPRAHTECAEAHAQHDGDRLLEALGEGVDGLVHGLRLVGRPASSRSPPAGPPGRAASRPSARGRA